MANWSTCTPQFIYTLDHKGPNPVQLRIFISGHNGLELGPLIALLSVWEFDALFTVRTYFCEHCLNAAFSRLPLDHAVELMTRLSSNVIGRLWLCPLAILFKQ